MSDDEQVLIDGMALAYEAFQGCRHPYGRNEPLLELLGRVLPLLVARDAPVVEVPASWLDDLAPDTRDEIARSAGAPRGRLHNRHLLPSVGIAARELLRLWRAGAMPAVRNLGYAFHFFPRLIVSGEPFDPKSFQFCFRITAHHWEALSFEMQRVLAALARIDAEEVARLVSQEGFTIDMHFSGPRKVR
jgi:hypothetical protein